MRHWIKKLLEQFEFDGGEAEMKHLHEEMSEEKATLLFLIDTYNKHLFEVDNHPLRKVRERLDSFAKSLVTTGPLDHDRMMFDFRQWFASYRIDEVTYIQNTFDDFKNLIWEFADQLHEELKEERREDEELDAKLGDLREAVESNSIDILRTRSREFINTYIEQQSRKSVRHDRRILRARKNLDSVKKQLVQANHSMQRDHLTGIFNRRSFDDKVSALVKMQKHQRSDCALIIADIDHFKNVNDTYGHDIGDFVIKECANILTDTFTLAGAMVARIGGEEFGIVLPNISAEHAAPLIENALNNIRKAVFVHGEVKIRFTMSFGAASLLEGEPMDAWYKRADTALYASKTGGRNRYTLAGALKAA